MIRNRWIFALSLLMWACGGDSHGGLDDESRSTPEVGAAGEAPGIGGTASAAGAASSGGSAGRTGSGSGGDTTSAGRAANPDLSRIELDGKPLHTRVQRLSNQQWERAVTDVLRLEMPRNLSANFVTPVVGASDFDNNERVLFVDSSRFLDFESGAEAAAALATGSPEALSALYEGDDAAGFVRSVGRRAFRRPLTPEEETKYQAVFARGEELYGPAFQNGAGLVLRALLQSPHFLYRTELGPAGEALSSNEVASKLSFALLGTTPSDSLLDSAGGGDLDSELIARQMLEDPRALEVMRDFHGQLLGLRLYRTVSKVGVPEYDAALNPELEQASFSFFDGILRDNLGLREVFTSRQAYVGPGLAPFYGMVPPAGLELRELGAARRGYFMQVPFLMLWGVNAESDALARGLALQKMLCDARPESKPLGTALEGFDGVGRERRTKDGKPIHTAGSYPFADGVHDFADGNTLMNLLADSAQAHTCYSKNVTAFALGRDLTEAERPLLESLSQVSREASLKELIVALVREPTFRARTEDMP